MDISNRHYAVLIYDVSRLTRKRFGERVKSLGFTETRWRVIAYLVQRPNLSQTELAELLDMEKAPLGSCVDKLRLEGWIERKTDPNDKRIKRLSLSPQCDPVVDKMQHYYNSMLDEATQNCHAPALDTTFYALAAITDKLRLGTAPDIAIPYNILSKTIEASRQLKKRFNRPVRELGFTPSQWLVLINIARHPAQTQTEIAEQLDLGKAPLGQLLDELEKNDWITRNVDHNDRRAKRLNLSSKASKLLEQHASKFTAIHADVIGDIDSGQLDVLSTTLLQIRNNLRSAAMTAKGNIND